MRVAIICDSVTSAIAGSFVSTIRFAKILSKRGNHIILISSRLPNTKKIDFFEGIKIYNLPAILIPKTDKKISIAISSSRTIKKILEEEKIEVIHTMLPTPLSIAAMKAAKKLKLGIVAHAHSQPDNLTIFLPKWMQKKVNIWGYKYINWNYNKSDVVACPSPFSERLMKSYGLKRKTEVVSNGVDTKIFKKIKVSISFLKKFKVSKKSKKILFVGRLEPEKNIGLLINAVPLINKKFENFELYVVGAGTQRAYLEKLVGDLKVKDKVKFLGRVSDRELVEAYNICDIFVLPSFVELEGMVVLESMACGKPILISNSKLSASSDFVNGNGFKFDPLSVEDFATKSLKLLTNPSLLKKMSDRSYILGKSYDINNSVDKLEKIYRSVIK